MRPVSEILDHWQAGLGWRVAILGAVDVDGAQTAVEAFLDGRPEEPVAFIEHGGGDGFRFGRLVTALEVVLAAGGIKPLGALVADALRDGRRKLLSEERLPLIEGAADYREEWSTASTTDKYEWWWNAVQGHGRWSLPRDPKLLQEFAPEVWRQVCLRDLWWKTWGKVRE